MVSDIKDVLHNIMGKDKTDDYALNHAIQGEKKDSLLRHLSCNHLSFFFKTVNKALFSFIYKTIYNMSNTIFKDFMTGILCKTCISPKTR